tara:strand:+ start:219144 stop:220568 length:1425 start_codon:yes stop_codon:yes gene_type:complete
MNKYLLSILVLINITIVTVCYANESDDGYFKLLSEIESIQKNHNIAGVSVILVNEHGITHENYFGLADRTSNTKVTEDTILRVGSITKTVTALAVLKLIEQNKLELSSLISDYLDPLPYVNRYSDRVKITVAQLLEHTAGFQDLSSHEFDFKQSGWALEQSFNYDKNSRITKWLPGEYYSYTNSGAGIVSKVIEVITGRKFEDYVQTEIFDPLNLNSATFFQNELTDQYLATGYDRDGVSVIPYWHMLYRAYGALNIRADEMASVVSMLINHGKSVNDRTILTRSSINTFEHPATSLAARHGLTYGYAPGNYQWISNNVLFHGHGGDADGYLSRYGYTRENNRGYFIAINSYNNKAIKAMTKHIEMWLTRGIKAKALPPVHKLTLRQINQISGDYISVTNRFAWDNKETSVANIFINENKLYIRYNSSPAYELVPVNRTHFRRKNQSLPTISIVENSRGDLILQGDIGNFKRRD